MIFQVSTVLHKLFKFTYCNSKRISVSLQSIGIFYTIKVITIQREKIEYKVDYIYGERTNFSARRRFRAR